MTIEDNTIDLDTIENAIARHEREIERLKREREKITTFQAKLYLHRDKSEYEEWEIDDEGNLRWDMKVHENIGYALYEVEFEVEFDLVTGEYKILYVKDGDQILVPKEDD